MSRHSSISGTPLEEADVLQREFDRVMAGTSSLPEPQQMLIEDHYLQMVQRIVDLRREQLRQRRANRQSTGRSMSSSYDFEGRYNLLRIIYKCRSQRAFFGAARKNA